MISGRNVSSTATQALVRNILDSANSNKSISGPNQTADVYSRLYSTIVSVNKRTYATLKGANSTSRLLLGVPALYLES